MFPSTKAFDCIACLSYVRVYFLYTFLEAVAVRLLSIHGNLVSCHHQGHRHTDVISGILTNLILNQNWGVRDRKFPISFMANTKQSMRNVLPNSGSKIETSWSPMQLKIEPWRPEFSCQEMNLINSCFSL